MEPGAFRNSIDGNSAELKFAGEPILQWLFSNCCPNTLQMTVKLAEEGNTFVITGEFSVCGYGIP